MSSFFEIVGIGGNKSEVEVEGDVTATSNKQQASNSLEPRGTLSLKWAG